MNTAIVKAGTAVIVCRDKQILIGKRKGSHGAGLYAFPGGHIDPTDGSFKESAEREVFEETGMVVNIFSPDTFRADLFTTFDILSEDGAKRYVTVYLLAQYISGGMPVGWVNQTSNLYKGKEQDKCEVWEFLSLDDLSRRVGESPNRQWIPLPLVVHYLQELWEKS